MRAIATRVVCGMVFCGVVLCGSMVTRAADLSASEKKLYDDAVKYAEQIKTNLKLAQDAAGPGDAQPPTSKARLSMARLDSARQSAANVAARLEKLPADNADVKKLQEDYDASMKSVQTLTDRLTGKSAKPAADGKGGAAAPGKSAPLGYRESETLKIARGNVEDVSARADAIEKKVAAMQAVKDKATLRNEDVQGVSASIAEARRRVGFADDQFEKLPADHSDVKVAADGLKAAVARIDAAEKSLAPVLKQSMKQVDPSSYPDFKTDVDRLKELADSLAVGNMQHDRAKIAELVKQLPALKAEVARLNEKYAPLLNQNTGQSAYLKENGQRLNYSVERFEEALKQEKQQLPLQLNQDIDQINKLTETAVSQQLPAYFKGGIADHFRYADDKLVLYEVLDPDGAKAVREKLTAARDNVKKQEASLAGAIIEANDLPADNYAGKDKPALVTLATDTLKKQHPKAEVLAVRIPSEQWQRETMWRYSNSTWRLIDRSKLQAQVIVKRDDKIAESHPIDLWTDHVSNDKVSAFPLFDDKEELSPQSLLLVAKVK